MRAVATPGSNAGKIMGFLNDGDMDDSVMVFWNEAFIAKWKTMKYPVAPKLEVPKPLTMTDDPILTLDNVVAGYGRMTILHGVSAAIRRGAITTVIGPNGAGKSTLFKTVFGMLGVRSGRVTFGGTDTTGLPPRRMLDAGMCYVPQGRNLFPELSVRLNLELSHSRS